MGDNKTFRLPILFCALIDFPKNTTECTTQKPESGDLVCFTCPIVGRFLFGEPVEAFRSAGHLICIHLWVSVLIVGTFGAVSNCLIIAIMKRHKEKRTFDFLLMVLASFDLLTCMMSLISTCALMSYYEDWDRGPETLFLFVFPFMIGLLGRSASSYITVLITIERYLIIAHPMKSVHWFTATKTKIMTIGASILALLINIPRLTSMKISKNDAWKSMPSLQTREYIVESTALEEFWYRNLKSIHYQIDMWAPFPLLITFNILLYLKIKTFAKNRQGLSKTQRRDIRAARMFVPVVIVLFICNIVPMSGYVVMHFGRVIHREVIFLLTFATVVNAAANLPIYYARGPSFRQEIKAELPLLCGWIKSVDNDPKARDLSMTDRNTNGTGNSTNLEY
ncbi:FMRFamide receptor [Orchesella cincta]|uniref:FMRFamide receptor n=1 Tax=Orchesella cincta TaxID=48709 RepID=A0A1D2NAW0_ORCCI|nr:FMRFamide receptor [Orchesella cincta]